MFRHQPYYVRFHSQPYFIINQNQQTGFFNGRKKVVNYFGLKSSTTRGAEHKTMINPILQLAIFSTTFLPHSGPADHPRSSTSSSQLIIWGRTWHFF